jgi:hypothetical protein
VDAQRYDAFVSYAHENAEWVRALATNLHRHGLDVFFDEWDIVGGVRLAERLQEGLADSRTVVLVVSAAAVHKEWWKEEFAAAMAGVAAKQQRLVPVLLDDVPLPPFVASRVYVDFRHVDSPDAYLAAVERLVRAVQEAPQVDGRVRTGGFVLPPGTYRAEGPRSARLRVTSDEVVFSTADAETRQPATGLDAGLRSAVLDLARVRSRGNVVLRGSSPATCCSPASPPYSR